MKWWIVRAAWSVLFSTGSALAQGAVGQLVAPPDLAALGEAIGQRWRAGGVPGASVVVIENGQVTLVLPHGMADLALKRPVTEATVFRAGSISKTLTAVALMQLVERGLVDLDASMTDRLPEWSLRGVSEKAHPLRLAHLLEHTSGLDDIRYRHYLLEGGAITLAEALPMFGPYRARWPPGSGTSYSNAGPIVAGRLLEVATGTSFDEFMARSVTGPMAMPSARWRRDPAQSGVLAASYQADARTPEPIVETPGRPSGSRWRHVGRGLFQKEGAAAPSRLFIDTADGVQAHMRDGAKRHLGGVERMVKVGAIALSIASLLAGLAALPVWTFWAARGRLAARGGASLRLWPLAALALALAAPISVLVLIGSGDLALLDRPNAWAWLSWTLSWLAPAASVAALTVLWRRRGQPAGPLAWTLAWTQTATALVVVAWFSAHGWIGLRIWDA